MVNSKLELSKHFLGNFLSQPLDSTKGLKMAMGSLVLVETMYYEKTRFFYHNQCLEAWKFLGIVFCETACGMLERLLCCNLWNMLCTDTASGCRGSSCGSSDDRWKLNIYFSKKMTIILDID